MILKYSFAKGYKPTKKKIKECDEGFEGLVNILMLITKKNSPLFVPIMWILTCFYKREITKESIEYNLYLVK